MLRLPSDGVTLEGYQPEIYFTFSNLADYIWKLPRFLDTEKDIEARKLWEYYPRQADPDLEREAASMRRWRAFNEFGKLIIEFPGYMATSNVFLACSVFEQILYRLCKRVERETLVQIPSQGKGGFDSLFSYLKSTGITVADVVFYEQVLCARDIRNCLLHANGNLAFSKNEPRIRQIVSARLYLDREIRDRAMREGYEANVRINSHEGGEYLNVDNFYPHFVCSRLREFLLALCKKLPLPDEHD